MFDGGKFSTSFSSHHGLQAGSWLFFGKLIAVGKLYQLLSLFKFWGDIWVDETLYY
jgi:hypothetical protein